MHQRDRGHLWDILEAARVAIAYVEGRARAEFLEETQLQDAVIRRLEIMGEAARRIAEPTRDSFPGVPWRATVGMRNVLIHEYGDVDLSIVWDTLVVDVPAVVVALEGLFPGEE